MSEPHELQEPIGSAPRCHPRMSDQDTTHQTTLLAVADLVLGIGLLCALLLTMSLRGRVQQLESQVAGFTNVVRFRQVSSPGSPTVTNVITLPEYKP